MALKMVSRVGRTLHVVMLAVVAAAVSPVMTTAAVVYQENFDGLGSTNLAGLAPDSAPGSETWGGATEFKANGFVSSAFAGIYLPFAPSPGFTYTLTGSFRVNSGSDWLGIGFAGGSPTSTARLSDNSGRGWVLAKSNQIQSFIGPNGNNRTDQVTINTQNPGTVTTQTITLDASSANPANWRFSATQVIGSTSYTVWNNQPALITSAGDITAIGLSSSSASGTFTSFSLTAVPEPSTIALAAVGLGLAAVAAARRRR
jgi:hypothetical protein